MLTKIVGKIRSSISAKIAIIVTLPVVLIMAVQSYYQFTLSRKQLFQSTEMQMLRVAESLKPVVKLFLINKNYDQLQSLVAEVSRGSDIEFIAVYDPQTRVIASNKEKWLGKSAEDMRPDDVTDNDLAAIKKARQGGYSIYFDPMDVQYCLAMPVKSGGAAAAVIQISLDVGSLKSAVESDFIEHLVFSLLAVVAIGATVHVFFTYYLTRRIQSVFVAAKKLASGDLAVRADEKGTDEIGELAISFNALAEGITIWHNNLEEIAALRLKELLVLFEVVNTISQSLEMGTVLPKVLKLVTDNMGVEKGAIVLVGSDGRTLALMVQSGLSDVNIRQITQSGMGGVGDVILRNKTLRIGAGNEEGSNPVPGLEQDNIMSALVAPISARGVIFGAIAVYSEKKDQFADQDESLLATIGNQVSVAVLNARLYEETLSLAQRDGLTGMANRRYLMERLNQEVVRAERYQTSLSLIMLDLDKFKSFNDTYGHPKGDELLRSFSALIKGMIRTSDISGRYGGEEFCIVLTNTSIKGALVIAERIRRAMEEVNIFVGADRPPAGRTVSIGVAEFSAGDTVEKMLSAADDALYRAKESGRNRVEE